MCNENPASNDANGDIDLSPDLVVFLKIFCRIMLVMPVYKTFLSSWRANLFMLQNRTRELCGFEAFVISFR